MSNSKLKSGLVPQTVTRRDGVQTTVYVRMDDGEQSTDSLSSALRGRSLRPTNTPDAEFHPEHMTVQDAEEAAQFADELRDDPTLLYEPENQAKAADSLNLLEAKYQAESENKEHLKYQVMGLFSERDIKRGEMKSDESGRYFIEVADEEGMVFNPQKAGLSRKQYEDCSERRMDMDLMREKFPDTWNEIAETTGTAIPEADESKRAVVEMRKKYLARARANANQKLGDKPPSKRVVSELMDAMDRVDKAEEDRDNMRFALADAAIPDEDRERFSGGRPSVFDNHLHDTYGTSTFSNPKSGTSVRFVPLMTGRTTSDFTNARYEHYLDVMTERNPNRDPDRINTLAIARAHRDWSRIHTMRISPEKVKEKHPKQYQAGKITREVWINEEE